MKQSAIKTIAIALGIFVAGGLLGGLGTRALLRSAAAPPEEPAPTALQSQVDALAAEVAATNALLAQTQAEQQLGLENLRAGINTVNLALFADKAEEVTRGVADNKERTLAITSWVAQNFTNLYIDYERADAVENSMYGRFANRRGLCADRSRVAIEMLRITGVPARMYVMRDVFEHNCLEAYYDDQWHFFDVSYAGYFEVDGVIWSWDQVKENPEAAAQNIVAFPDFVDDFYTSTAEAQQASIADPETHIPGTKLVHMQEVYTVENLEACTDYGPCYDPTYE